MENVHRVGFEFYVQRYNVVSCIWNQLLVKYMWREKIENSTTKNWGTQSRT